MQVAVYYRIAECREAWQVKMHCQGRKNHAGENSTRVGTEVKGSWLDCDGASHSMCLPHKELCKKEAALYYVTRGCVATWRWSSSSAPFFCRSSNNCCEDSSSWQNSRKPIAVGISMEQSRDKCGKEEHHKDNGAKMHATHLGSCWRCLGEGCDENHDERNKTTQSGGWRGKWRESVATYLQMMTITWQKEDFADEAIDVDHDMCLDFMGEYIDLAGPDNVTNYIHLIGSGHLVSYLKNFRNLYKFSQQGWAALNAKVRCVYLSQTQRGGNVFSKMQNWSMAVIDLCLC